MCITLIKENEVLIDDQIQWRTNIDNKGGGSYSYICIHRQ